VPTSRRHGEPLVTIVIPTHNYARYVGQAIASGLDQRYRSIEIIVVDDGSTDETPELLRSFEAAAPVACTRSTDGA
jgi:glycosyltransferase involved in cell wall biosynthesis